jgi:receptor-interacting serine/threonine-protein kinase 5
VVFAFEFTRQMQVAPRRLEYARQQEEQLYDELLAVARNKEENIRLLIAKTLDQDRDLLLRRVQQMPLEGSVYN